MHKFKEANAIVPHVKADYKKVSSVTRDVSQKCRQPDKQMNGRRDDGPITNAHLFYSGVERQNAYCLKNIIILILIKSINKKNFKEMRGCSHF